MRDFTLDIYRELLESLQWKGYKLISYSEYCQILDVRSTRSRDSESRFVILRHDVDKLPENSLKTAQIEHSLGARASYYFRTGESGCYDGSEFSLPDAIRRIAQLGHEIGYHYEDMSLADGDVEKAYAHFQTWLAYLRQFYAVETICMHGAPTSKYDGKDLWKKYNYRDLGIVGEPYFDVNFGDVFYLTDTGRCWDGYKVSVRDRIPQHQDEWTSKGWSWHTTPQLLEALKRDQLPSHIMVTTHPQRWTNEKAEWWKELVLQNIKNMVKRLIIKN